jgi:hypothetical protein
VTGQWRASDDRGQVAITRFECHTLSRVIVILAMHLRIKKEVRRVADGYLGGTTLVLWKQRTVLSFSLWEQLDSIYAMGEVSRHVVASRLPSRLGISTACGIYAYSGDWRQLMFRTAYAAGEPLFAIRTATADNERNST